MPSKLTETKREIRDLKNLIRDLEFNVATAQDSIRNDGVLIEVPVCDSGGNVVPKRKINPAFKIREDSMAALKSLGKQLELLCDAVEAAQPQNEEFKI